MSKTKKKAEMVSVYVRLLPAQHAEVMRRVRADGGLSKLSDIVRRLVAAGIEATR